MDAFERNFFSTLVGWNLADHDKVPENVLACLPEAGVERVAFDQSVHFGDGGEAIICLPVYTRQNAIDDDLRIRLFKALNALPVDQQV